MAKIDTVEAADAYLRDVFIPDYNARFGVAAEQAGTAFTPIPGVDLDEVLCVHEERQVGNDNCVSFNRLKLQLPPSPLRAHFVKARVRVHHYVSEPRHLPRPTMSGPLRRQRRPKTWRKTPPKPARCEFVDGVDKSTT